MSSAESGSVAVSVRSASRQVVMAAVAVLVLAAGGWASWGTARRLVFPDGLERGSVTVTRCAGTRCSGSFVSASAGAPGASVSLARSAGEKRGVRVPVVREPGSKVVVRSDGAGFLAAWIPLGGALLLVAPLVGGGMRRGRWGWCAALAGVTVLSAAFAALVF
ncbi:hypothetical protein [Streptomyces beihaiensis]|uniref:Integral membrane protein n=1 Tax=Streptomyces beihaiensis TaxID=2984495 RepID=A0ABT3TV51_9ACTN|nr:hypothetical protein [Streptomyces beihaiensis]MCX3060660.1 hypothetical protein [Streptomyces beihaiensis]